MPRPLEKTMTPEMVAELLEVCLGTLKHWRKNDKGPAYYRLSTTRGHVRYDAASVRKWMRQRLVTPGEGNGK